jgi:hypothetical protein
MLKTEADKARGQIYARAGKRLKGQGGVRGPALIVPKGPLPTCGTVPPGENPQTHRQVRDRVHR